MKTAKEVKNMISKRITNRKKGVSVMLGECDEQYHRIHIKFPAGGSISLNPVWDILVMYDFRIAQIISWWFPGKQTILLVRNTGK